MENYDTETLASENHSILTKKDIFKAWIIWFFFSHASYNYERLQANSFAHSMFPIFKKLYKSNEEIANGLKRHALFFNTEPNFGSIIHGIAIAMEEKKATGSPVTDDGINSIKTGLMGPVAGIGDTMIQGVILPILLAFGIGMAMEGNIMGPILYTVIITVVITGISYFLWVLGYKQGSSAIENLLESGRLDNFMTSAKVLGCMVIGALTSQYVLLESILVINVGESTVNLQADVFDKIMPNLLPLLLTLGALFLLNKKVGPLKIMVALAVVGGLGALTGVL